MTKTKVLYSTVNLIDLAGSESAEAHNNTNGQAPKTAKVGSAKYEMLNINRSLLTLTAVIRQLAEKSSQWIPYRDSKLTKYLENALQGNAKISVICNISPGEFSYEQSQSTLNFATLAKKIKQTVQRNETTEDDKTMIITRLEAEIKNLKERLQYLEISGPSKNSPIKTLDPIIEASQKIELENDKELAQVKDKITKLASKIATSETCADAEKASFPKTAKESISGSPVKLPETFHGRVSLIMEVIKAQNKAEEIKRNSVIQTLVVEKSNNIESTPFELSPDLQKLPSIEDKNEEVKSPAFALKNIEPLHKSENIIPENTSMNMPENKNEQIDSKIYENKEQQDKDKSLIDLIEDEPVIQLPDYLDPKLSMILVDKFKDEENKEELKGVLHDAEEALAKETIGELHKQLEESDLEKQKLRTENKELTLAVSEMASLLESALNELKEYREKYGEIYKK